MTFTTHTLAAAVLVFAAGAAGAQTTAPAAGEWPFADGAITQTGAPPLTRAAVQATAVAKDLEAGNVMRPAPSTVPPAAMTDAAPTTDQRPRTAGPQS